MVCPEVALRGYRYPFGISAAKTNKKAVDNSSIG